LEALGGTIIGGPWRHYNWSDPIKSKNDPRGSPSTPSSHSFQTTSVVALQQQQPQCPQQPPERSLGSRDGSRDSHRGCARKKTLRHRGAHKINEVSGIQSSIPWGHTKKTKQWTQKTKTEGAHKINGTGEPHTENKLIHTIYIYYIYK